MMSTQAKKPEIRFAGFKDEWAKKKFDDVFDMLSNNTLSRDALNSEAGTAKNIHYGDVLTKFGEYLDVSIEKLPFISDPAIATKLIRSYLKDGDIVIADTAEDETVGKCTEVIGAEEMPIIAGLHTMPCRSKEKYAPKYMGYYLNSNAYHDNLFPLMQGVKVTSISRTGVKETEVILSTEFDEQEMIGEHLSSLNDMIALETEKYEKLVIIKKAMLEKMFPKEGCDVPEIRFIGFTESWEQRKLGTITQICDSARIPNDEWAEEGIPYIRASDLTNDDLTGVLFLSEETYKKYNSKTGSPFKGDVLFNGGGEIGKSMLKCDNKPLYVQGGAVLYARTSESDTLLGEYLNTYFASPQAMKYIEVASAGGTMKHFTLGPSNAMPIMYPSVDEQRKIGRYFERLNNLITLHQRKLEKLKNIKSACMEKMFV